MERKRRGRRRAPEGGSTVCAWLTASEHDDLIALARAERARSVSAFVRAVLQEKIRACRIVLLENSISATYH